MKFGCNKERRTLSASKHSCFSTNENTEQSYKYVLIVMYNYFIKTMRKYIRLNVCYLYSN